MLGENFRILSRVVGAQVFVGFIQLFYGFVEHLQAVIQSCEFTFCEIFRSRGADRANSGGEMMDS